MARLFVPTGFEASKVSPDLYYDLLTELSEDTYVLLEFHSGGRDQRQIDVAVLGPYGVDVVEVKAKTGGAVIASANGPWKIRGDDGSFETIPLNGAARENPYDQVERTAADFKRYLEIELKLFTRVFPLVVVLSYRRDHNLRNRGFIWAANGLKNFKQSLRSQRLYKDHPQTLDVQGWERIVRALGLTELHANGPAPAPQGDIVTHSFPQNSVTTPQPAARDDSVLARLPKVPHAQVTSPAPGSADAVLRSRPKLHAVRLAAGLAICIAAVVLGPGWFTSQEKTVAPGVMVQTKPAQPVPGKTVAPVVVEQTKPAQLVPVEATVSEAVSADEALPGITYRPAQRAAIVAADGLTATEGSSCPYLRPVKGNINREGRRIFHVEGQKYYEQTKPEKCFSSPEAALAEGFRASLR